MESWLEEKVKQGMLSANYYIFLCMRKTDV